MQESIIIVTPKEGFTIVDPFGGEVLTAAKRVRNDIYWQRMRDQGCIEIKPAQKEIEADAI